MDVRQGTRLSKFLSLILRHEPERIGVELDPAGWTGVDGLLEACRRHGIELTLPRLEEVVARNEKRRFSFSADRTRIRANQGHSVPVDLGLEPRRPPETLYHGTADRFLPSIRRQGLHRRRRHHVHLSPDHPTAFGVGRRRGRVVVLEVQAGRMHREGHVFYLSANGVWLVDAVPPGYLSFPGVAR